MFKALIPGLADIDVTIDRIHRLPKPSHLPETVPRDVLLRLHFFHIKEQLMQVMRKHESVPQQYQDLQFYADLSQHTLLKRRNLNTVTKVLRNHRIIYRWGYPTKLSVTKDNRTFTITSLERGLDLLRDWGILPEIDEGSTSDRNPRRIEPEWRQVTASNAKSHT